MHAFLLERSLLYVREHIGKRWNDDGVVVEEINQQGTNVRGILGREIRVAVKPRVKLLNRFRGMVPNLERWENWWVLHLQEADYEDCPGVAGNVALARNRELAFLRPGLDYVAQNLDAWVKFYKSLE